MNFKMHDGGQNQKTLGFQDPANFIDRLLGIGDMLKGFEVKSQPDALIGDRFHICNITKDIDTGWIEVLHILFDITFPGEKGLVIIRFPACAGIKDWLIIRKVLQGPFHIIDYSFSQSHLPLTGFSATWVRIEYRRGAQT